MRSISLLLRFTLIVLIALTVAQVNADDDDDDVGDGDIPTTAGTFYVRRNGNDANAGTNPGQAFRTIRRAASMAPAGSVIYVGAGTYTSSADFVGLVSTLSQPLQVIADTNGSRTGDSGAVILGAGTRMAFLGCEQVRVTGFTFQGPTSRCFEWRSSKQGIVQACTFIGGTGGVKIRSGDIKFQDCTVKDFTGNGIDVYGTAELFMVNCTIQNCGSAGLQMNRYARVTVESSKFLENTGDGLAVDSITSTDDGMIGTPPSQLLLDALNLLVAAKPSATNKGKDKLDDAIKELNESLLPKYWQDPWHPHSKATESVAKSKGIDAKEGKDVFKSTKEAMDKLKDFMKGDAGKDAELGNYGTVKSNVTQAHTLMVEATRTMALLALQEAILAGADSKEIEKFQKEYKKAEKEIDKGHLHHAADKYGKAWEKAAEAAGSAYAKPPAPNADNDNPTDADKKSWLTISSSTFKKNMHGLRCLTKQNFAIRASELSENKQSGLYLTGGGKVEDCTIAGNNQGVYLKDTTDLTQIKRLTITNNVQHGLYTEKCNLAFTGTNIVDWKISGSQYVIAGKESDISFETLTISGGSIAGVHLTNGNTKAYKVNFTGNGTGLSVDDCNFALYECTLSGNKVGLNAAKSKSMSIQNSQINDNTEWGVKQSGRGSFTDTTISGNGIGGLELTKTTSSDLTLTRTKLTDNKTYGIYCNDSTMTFSAATMGSATITGSETVFAGFESSLTFDGLTISGGSQYGIANYSGKVGLNNCTLSGNGVGLYSDYGCAATKSTFTGNTTTGASVLGSATFTSCLFEKNPNGLQITNDKAGSVKLVGSQIKDNAIYGVWCDGCTLTFNAAMQADWYVQNNGSNFGATGSTLTFDGFTISNGTTYGVVSQNGTLNLLNSTLTGNGTGAYIDANSTLAASGTKFTANALYGASLRGQASLTNCSLDHNTHGLHFANMTGGAFTSSGTKVSDNTQAGLHLDSCTLTLTGTGIAGLTLADNQYGIYSTNSTLAFDGFTSNSNTYGAWLTSSNVTMTNSKFTGSTFGLWAENNNSLTVNASTFSGNSSYGVHLQGNGSLHNCAITGNGSGLYLNATDVTDAKLTGTDISGNTLYGVYSYNGSLDLTSQSAEGWSIDGNGYNISGYQSNITLTGAKLTNAVSYGVFAQYGNLNVQQSTITSKSGGVWGLYNDSFNVDRSHISGSSTGAWGVVNVDSGLTMRNTVVSGAQYGVYSYGAAKPSTVYNTTIAGASQYGLYVYDGDVTVMNTIISGTGGTYGLYREPSANLAHSYNLVHGFAVPFENAAADDTEILDPPRFTDAANGDYSLSKGSPAINAGADMSLDVTIDMMGNARPSHKVFEIGAYEYMKDGGSLRVLDWKEKR